ncbi:EKC/KEOPS complex subunit TPRKB [Octopus bimaculoides]|uniref:EKC/KEOPS complex subunit TPRKB n=1 Tax=Octopus bimaculoides TaxID=37653 RepID=A0A0L8GGU9_OCTBM|nr:EKC/KEOPS complex subunit TPRKB [Octopus bimaculoides]|eukprot:XP_014781144.1 PREDICTED: EKC/KEOPS complex subunit Tprkb-like [Octopus bimaculoides]
MAETNVPAVPASDAGDISSNVVTINIQGGGHVTFALYNNVGNMKEVRQSVMNGEIEAALLKTSMIHDPFQVLTAAHKALHHRRTKKMITKNIHSEILYCLSPLKGISDSFRKFGVGDKDNTLFTAIVDDVNHTVLTQMNTKIKGDLVSVSLLPQFSDETEIKKMYKVTADELNIGNLVDAVVSRIAVKEIIAV